MVSLTSQPKVDLVPFDPRIEEAAPFPDSERVICSNNPLEIAICQFRFAAVLKITAEPPAEFQDGLRKDYPQFREIPPIYIAPGSPPELVSVSLSKDRRE